MPELALQCILAQRSDHICNIQAVAFCTAKYYQLSSYPFVTWLLLQGLIVLFVAVGLAIVVVLPFMIARRRGGRRAPGDKGISLATFFGGKASHSN